jgi:HSP20 family protein
VRRRKITYRYAEVVGGLSRAFEAEIWGAMRPRALASPLFRPSADVLETPTHYLVTLEAPGVSDDDIDVLVHPDALVVSGRRRCPSVESAHYHASEIRYGPFRYDLILPADADPDSVDSSLDRGLLKVTIGKRPPERA